MRSDHHRSAASRASHPFNLRRPVFLCILCASSFSFLLGYDIGIMSGAKRLIAREMGLSTSEIEVLVSILNLISGPGGLISGRLADQLGRRPTSAIACSLTLLGSLAMAASTSFPALLTSRIITGLGVGSCFHVAPLYIAEVAPKQIRGRLVSCFDLFINVGILIGFIVGYALTPASDSTECAGAGGCPAWRWMLGLGALPPALILLGLTRLPESPRFLVAAGREREASAVLDQIYEADEADSTFEMLRADGKHAKPLSLGAGLRRVCLPAKGAPRALILAGMGCAFFQQATGVEAAVCFTRRDPRRWTARSRIHNPALHAFIRYTTLQRPSLRRESPTRSCCCWPRWASASSRWPSS